jgi:O-antigen/teichoic acid export membrane protein
MNLKAFLSERSGYLKNISTLVAGTAIAQAISLAAAPAIARLYTPAEIGTFTFLISIAGGISLIASFRYEMAIILPDKRADSVNIMFLSFLLSAAVTIVSLVLILIEARFDLLGIGSAYFRHRWIFMLPMLIFFLSANSIYQNWMNHNREYRLLAISKVLSSAGNNLTTLLFGVVGIGVFGLWFGNFLGVLLTIILFSVMLMLKNRADLQLLSLKPLNELARRYRHLPLANTPQVVVDMAQVYGPIYLLSIFFSNTVLGFYSMSMRLLQAPMWLIGSSIGQIFYKDAAEYYLQNGNLKRPIVRTIGIALIIALPVMLVLLTAGPWVMSVVFGQQWREAGVYARILAPWMFFDFIRSTIYSALMVTGRIKSMLAFSLAGAALMIIPLFIGGIIFRDARATLILVSACQSLYSAGVISWIVSQAFKEGLKDVYQTGRGSQT